MTGKTAWTMLIIPAIAPEDTTYAVGPGARDVYRRRAGEVLLPDREPREVLDHMRVAIGSMNFAAQYQQDPVPAEGNVIKREWICFFEKRPDTFDLTMSSWDLASTIGDQSSYSVGQHWGVVDGHYFLLDVFRRRLEAPALRRAIIDTTRAWGANVNLIEETELGRTMVQDLKRTVPHSPLLLHRPKVDKTARLLAQSARFEARQVFLPANAPWRADYIRELLAFPYGRHDDQVDATSQALEHLTARIASSKPIRRRDKVRRDIVRRDVEGRRS